MFQPQTCAVALLLMFVTMLCWSSWANFLCGLSALGLVPISVFQPNLVA